MFSVYGRLTKQQAGKTQQTGWKINYQPRHKSPSSWSCRAQFLSSRDNNWTTRKGTTGGSWRRGKTTSGCRDRNLFHTCKWCRVSGERSLSRLFALSFCGLTGCLSFRDVLLPRRPVCFPSDLLERCACIPELAHIWATYTSQIPDHPVWQQCEWRHWGIVYVDLSWRPTNSAFDSGGHMVQLQNMFPGVPGRFPQPMLRPTTSPCYCYTSIIGSSHTNCSHTRKSSTETPLWKNIYLLANDRRTIWWGCWSPHSLPYLGRFNRT